MAEALKLSEVQKALETVGTNEFEVCFIKADGSVRCLRGKFGVIPEKATGKDFSGAGKAFLKSVFDIEAQGYRSFYLDKVTFIKVGDVELGKKPE